MFLTAFVNRSAERGRELGNVEYLSQEIQLPFPEDKVDKSGDEQDKYIKRALNTLTAVTCPSSSPTSKTVTKETVVIT
jgi:hypothetical protein